jgi:hypothetical protein|nr:MAG TPA: hypothetical protein [Bacteriophage sp.]
MASARCYTKSGGVEKYESNLWISPTFGNWSSMGVAGTITTPDSNGNYTVTPEQSFEDSSDTTTYSCFTEYGGIKKTFYFKKKNNKHNINLSCDFEFTGVGMNILLSFGNNEYLGNDKLSVSVEVTTILPTQLIDSVFFSVSKNSRSPLKRLIDIGEEPGRRYKVEIKRCNPMSGDNYQVSYI